MAKGNFMNSLKPIRLRQLKIKAALLLKDLAGADAGRALETASRFLQIRTFADKHPEWLIHNKSVVRLKHAYHLIATEYGFKTWAELKQAVVTSDCLYRPSAVAFIHSWFKDYAFAEKYFLDHGGYLLCFWKDYIVCGEEYITRLGLGGFTEEWKLIQYNWVRPENQAAFLRIREQAIKNYLSHQ